jgi:hypothetical protein
MAAEEGLAGEERDERDRLTGGQDERSDCSGLRGEDGPALGHCREGGADHAAAEFAGEREHP